MEAIVHAVNATQTIQVSENIRAVCKAIVTLKESGKVNDVKMFLETVNFESALEKLIAIKLIDAFKLQDNLISAFSTEDLFVVSQSLKCDWFFEDDKGLLSDKDLVLNFFSKLSYSGRCKVIRKYSKILKDTDKAESLMFLLDEVFGVRTSVEFLPACSESFITDFLYSKDVDLPDRVVQQLYLKYPDFTLDFIFSCYEKKKNAKLNNSNRYEKTILKMASEKTPLFIEFYNKYGSLVNLDMFGRNLTHKIVKAGYTSILRNTDSYLKILHLKHLVSYISRAQIEELHFCLLPQLAESLIRCYDNHWELLDNIKKSIAEEIVVKNFKKKYGKDPLEINLDKGTLKHFPLEIRTKWAENKMSNRDLKDSDIIELCQFLPFDQAFNKLKSLLPSALDLETRVLIIESMMKSASLNGDSRGASEIVNFVVSRLRNDNVQVKGRSLDALKDFDLTKLSLEQWSPIIELFNVMIINDDIDSYSNELIEAYEKYVQCKLKLGLPIDTEMEMILDRLGFYCEFNIAKGTEFEHTCLNWFNERLINKKFVNDREKFNYATRLFCSANEFNVSHTNQCVMHKDWILDVVKDKIGESYSRSDILKTLKKNQNLKVEIYKSVFPRAVFPEILLFHLSNDVQRISNNVEDILLKILNSSQIYSFKPFFQRLLLFVDLSNKFSQSCLKLINSDDEDVTVRNKENAIIVLSFLNPNAFLSMIESYYPTGPLAETEGSEAYNRYRLQSTIAASLKNLNPPYKSLEAVKKFSIGDYLKHVLGSILSVSLKISQTRALAFIEANLDTPVSYRKHIIRVFRLVASKTAVSDLLLKSIQNEKNISLRIILFHSVFDMIKYEKNTHSWETLKQSFSLMTDVDLKQLTSKVFNLSEIPSEYQAEYIELVWATLVRLQVSDESKTKVFSLINETTVTCVGKEFVDFLFNMTYTDLKKEDLFDTWNLFIALYLNYSKMEDYERKLKNFMELIKKRIPVPVGSSLDSTAILSPLMLEILNMAIAEEVMTDPSKLLSDLKACLLEMFPEHEIHKIIFYLSLHLSFIKNNRSKNLIGFADDICGLVDLHCSTYGPLIIEAIGFYIKDFVLSHYDNADCKDTCPSLVFSNRILTGPSSPFNKIASVMLFSTKDTYSSENDVKLCQSILDAVKLSPDHSLKIIARKKLFSL